MAYTVSLREFAGPLDLLLTLIGKAKIDIRDIFISDITEQYLAYMQELTEPDMDQASEFLAMAATLLEIKSRALLPKRKKDAEEDEEDPGEELVRRLEEYKAIKDACERMQELETAAKSLLTKLPEEYPLPPKIYELTGLTPEGLSRAFLQLMQRIDTEEHTVRSVERRLTHDTFSVTACVYRIRHRLERGPVAFFDLFSPHPTRNEVVSVFLAMLELLRLGKAEIFQESTFSEIVILPAKEQPADSASKPDEKGETV